MRRCHEGVKKKKKDFHLYLRTAYYIFETQLNV